MTADLRRIGRDLQTRLKEFFDNPLGPDATPLEILHVVLDELERKVQPAGRGRRVFPYTQVTVRITHPGADPAAIEAVFTDLDARLRERLTEVGCDVAPDLSAIVVVTPAPGALAAPAIALDCAADAVPPRPAQPASPTAARPPLAVMVVKGQCEQAEYTFDEPVIAIGRLAEPTDALGQVRYNHVAFTDTRDGVNETVGRAHARLQFDPSAGHYFLFNEGSSNPTSIIRAGRMIRVAPRDPRGVRVQSGDQIQLGRALMKITF